MHPFRPVDHVKPPPRIVPPLPPGQAPVRPPSSAQKPVEQRDRPSFLTRKPRYAPQTSSQIPVQPPTPAPAAAAPVAPVTRVLTSVTKPVAAPAGERRGGLGKTTTYPPAVTVRAPAAPLKINYDEYGRPTLTPDEVPF
jgi:hypothetical protein